MLSVSGHIYPAFRWVTLQVLEVDAVVKHTVKIPTAEKHASEAKKLTFITDTSIQ